METVYLEVMVREEAEIGKRNILSKEGYVPCVVYGEGKKTLSLKIDHSRLVKFMHAHHGGENIIITLKISSKDSKKTEEKSVLIKEIQVHPVTGKILHLDFNEISLTKKIDVNVPIHSKGEPVGVKQEGGTLEHILWEVEVECLPTNIPEKFEVDVSGMKIGDIIHVKDLAVPEGIKIKHEADAIVFNLVPPHMEEALEEGAEEGAPESSEPEVIKKEKKPVEGEEEEKEAPKAPQKEK